MAQSENNNGLYFIVGGLLVALAVAFFYFYQNGLFHSASPPTASIETPAGKTEIRVDENGASITHDEKQ